MAKKILLIYDDFSEMERVQSNLMKVGFDVLGIVNEARLVDHLVAFNPDLVLTAGRGGKVSAPSVAAKIKEYQRYNGRVLILLPSSQRPSLEEISRMRMDKLLEMPCPLPKLLEVIAKLLEIEGQILLDKLQREPAVAEVAPTPIRAQSREQPRDKMSRAEREAAFLKKTQIDPAQTSFDRVQIKEKQDDLKKGWDFKQLEEIDELKRKFAKALFKK